MSPSTNTRSVLAISAAHFVHDIFTSIIPAIAFLLKDHFNLSYFELTLMITIPKLPGLFNPLLSTIIDRFGLRYFIILAPLIGSFLLALVGLMHSFPLLLLLLFLLGINTQAFHIPAPVIIKKLSTTNTGRNMSFFMMGGESARSIGPLLIMSFLTYYSLTDLWWAIPLVLISSLLLFYQLRSIPAATFTPTNSLSIHESLKILRSKKDLILTIIAVSLCKGFSASTLSALLSTYLKESGVSSFLSGSSLSLFALAGLLGVSLSGKLSDYIGRTKTILIYLLLAPLSLLIFSYTHSSLLPGALFSVGLIATSITPVAMAYVQELANEIPSFANGIYMTANFMLTSLIVLFTGKLADYYGIELALKYSALMAFSGLILFVYLHVRSIATPTQ